MRSDRVFCEMGSLLFVRRVRLVVGSGRDLCRFGFVRSQPKFDVAGGLSGSGVGNLMGDLFPFCRLGVSILWAEDDDL